MTINDFDKIAFLPFYVIFEFFFFFIDNFEKIKNYLFEVPIVYICDLLLEIRYDCKNRINAPSGRMFGYRHKTSFLPHNNINQYIPRSALQNHQNQRSVGYPSYTVPWKGAVSSVLVPIRLGFRCVCPSPAVRTRGRP